MSIEETNTKLIEHANRAFRVVIFLSLLRQCRALAFWHLPGNLLFTHIARRRHMLWSIVHSDGEKKIYWRFGEERVLIRSRLLINAILRWSQYKTENHYGLNEWESLARSRWGYRVLWQAAVKTQENEERRFRRQENKK